MGTVHFTEESWKQIQDYTELCPVEVACMGYATLVEDVVEVSEVFLVPQVVSGSSVEFVDTGFPWAVAKAVKENRLDELRFCWHSHVNFAARFSDTDKDMIRKVHNSGPIPWFASAILNKKGETWGQLDYFATDGELGQFAKHITVPLDVTYGEFDEYDLTEREEELEKFLTKKPTAVTKVTTPSSKTAATKSDEALDEKVGPSGCTPNDWKLHNLAKTKEWACYIDEEHYVHYWDEKDGNKYKGAAPMPKNSDGSWKLDHLKPSNVDERFVDEVTDSGNEADVERLVDEMLKRGQL